MEKDAEAFRTISEVADELDVPQHVLRFWESKFPQIKPLKRGGGRRYYRRADVHLLQSIRQLLYGDGYTIKGVQRILKEQGPRAVAALATGQVRDAPPVFLDADETSVAIESDVEDGSDLELSPPSGLASGRGLRLELQMILADLAECRDILQAARGDGRAQLPTAAFDDDAI